jgi:hypothetical protein
MGRHLVFVIFLPFVFSAWDAHTYWNGRYAANGIDTVCKSNINKADVTINNRFIFQEKFK